MADSNPELTLKYWIDLAGQLNIANTLEWAKKELSERQEKEEKLEKQRQEKEEKLLEKRQEREERLEKERYEREKERQEREDRRQEREDRLKERELKKMQLQVEETKAKVEAEERIKIKALEVEKMKLEKNVTTSSTEVEKETFRIHMPNVPPYKTGDDIASYLIRFEGIAESMHWDDEVMARNLSLLISDQVLDIYTSFPYEVRSTYKELKPALISALKFTPDHYRKSFKTSKPSDVKTYHQFVTNLFRLFDNWLESSQVMKTFEDLRQHIVRDQFFSAIGPEVRKWLKKFTPLGDLYELANAADLFADAEGKTQQRDKKSDRVSDKKVSVQSQDTAKSNYSSKITCHGCGEKGHKKSECPQIDKSRVGKYSFQSNSDISTQYSLGQYMCNGSINGIEIKNIIRDTGCDGIIVSSSLFPQVSLENSPRTTLVDYLGRVNEFPIHRCFINCPWFSGWTTCVVAPLKNCTVLLGNIEGVSAAKFDDITPCDK